MNNIDIRRSRCQARLTGEMGCVEHVNGAPLANGRGEAPADGDTGNGTSGAYRPRYEAVAEQILRLIGDLALRPGDRMPTENQLATRLATSRTVVRDAVKILSATGQVSVQKGRGLYVADGESMLGAKRWGGFFVPTNLDHIFMLFEFRRVQEAQATRLAADRASPSELREIEAAVDTCRHGYTCGDESEFTEGDDAFHLGIAAASHNVFFVSAVSEARALRPSRPGRPATAVTDCRPGTAWPHRRPSAHHDNTL